MTYHVGSDIKVGDTVELRTPQGQLRRGRVVMLGPHGWVLNMGGKHGTPGIVNNANFVRIVRRRRAK